MLTNSLQGWYNIVSEVLAVFSSDRSTMMQRGTSGFPQDRDCAIKGDGGNQFTVAAIYFNTAPLQYLKLIYPLCTQLSLTMLILSK